MYKKTSEFGLILSSNLRSYIYLLYLIKNKITLTSIIFLKNKKEKKYNKKIIQHLIKNKKKCKLKVFLSRKINNKKITTYLLNQKEKIFVVSLYPGHEGIIRSSILLKKKFFLHSHTGKLPKYKGSTTIYYSLLEEGKIWCDTFFLNNKIDQGRVIYSNQYPIPSNIYSIANIYDAKIRAKNIIFAINKLKIKNLIFKKKKINYSKLNFYVIHPLLRYITYNKFKNV
jgi:methionyl-tRNA formyltransferase